MASLLTHAVVGVALGQAAESSWRGDWRFWCAAILCSMLPDIDVIGFGFGIRYGDLWGHRGMTHSILFAAVIGILAGVLPGKRWSEGWRQGLLLFIIAASHGALDAMTNGGLGVAFFSPFDLRRYFFPWRPIAVSPLGISAFFSARGIDILRNEILCVWIPALLIGIVLYRFQRQKVRQASQNNEN